jgi:hypothetical protein
VPLEKYKILILLGDEQQYTNGDRLLKPAACLNKEKCTALLQNPRLLNSYLTAMGVGY